MKNKLYRTGLALTLMSVALISAAEPPSDAPNQVKGPAEVQGSGNHVTVDVPGLSPSNTKVQGNDNQVFVD